MFDLHFSDIAGKTIGWLGRWEILCLNHNRVAEHARHSSLERTGDTEHFELRASVKGLLTFL